MQNNKFSINLSHINKVCVIELTGHLSNGLSEELVPLVEQKISEGFHSFVFDLANAGILDSPGIASILTITERVVDEIEGNLVFCNLSDMHVKVLEMVGVFLYASYHTDRESAIHACSE